MNFVHHNLGNRKAGEVVQVFLKGSAANVRLMDSINLANYRAGRRHRYSGGLAKQSPVNLQIPHTGHWHVAVDMQGLRGSVRSSAKVLLRALPEIQQPALSSVPSIVRDIAQPTADNGEIYDVFISHASEDKEAVVRDLAESLRSKGLRVWYDDFTMRIGDSLRQKIDRGLARSRVGIVVISKAFIAKGWTNYELDGIVTRSVSGEQILLPVWHEVTKQEVVEYSPSLADKVARSTSTHTVDEISTEIAELLS